MQKKKTNQKIENLKLPGDFPNYLIARSSPEPLFAAVGLDVNDAFFMRDFPDQVDRLQRTIAEFHSVYGSKSSCKADYSDKEVQDLCANYSIIKNFMLKKEITDSENSLNDYNDYLFWVIDNSFGSLAIEMLEKIPDDKIVDSLKSQRFLYDTPILHYAVARDLEDLVIKMLEKIPENQRFGLLKIKNFFLSTAVHIAASRNIEDLAIKMLEKIPENQGFDLLKVQDSQHSTILHLAVEQGSEGQAEQMLEKAPENQRFDLLKVQDWQHRTILH